MAVQDFKERVRQVAIEQAKVYEQVFLRHEYLLCVVHKSKPMTLLRGNRLDPSKSASVDLILRRSTGASFFDEIVYGNERMLAKYRERIKMMLAENLKETKELQPI